jgi:hypothetical protein
MNVTLPVIRNLEFRALQRSERFKEEINIADECVALDTIRRRRKKRRGMHRSGGNMLCP